jgi:hypothetical protein
MFPKTFISYTTALAVDRLVLRKSDYSLFHNIIKLNIGEESRHLDEWRALQNLPPHDLAAYKEKVMVHFGYDKKDGPPTTFHFAIEIMAVRFHFCLDENNPVADLQGSRLEWSLLKKKDKISHQKLSFESIYLSHTSSNKERLGVNDLLFPLKENGHISDKKYSTTNLHFYFKSKWRQRKVSCR